LFHQWAYSLLAAIFIGTVRRLLVGWRVELGCDRDVTALHLATHGGHFGGQRVQYKLCSTVHRCLQHKAPQYMMDCCIQTSDIARRQHLRSAGSRQLFVPRHRRSMFGRRDFSVADPAAWNSLPDYLPDPTRSFDSFRSDLKTFFLDILAYTAH